MSKIIALAGNPNVGKSTIFNSLTKMHQHTGNWPGKTVENAVGYYTYQSKEYQVVDLPGTYSLISSSKEEEIARDFLCFSHPDITLVVCDATNLRRNLNLVLQILELQNNVIVVVNLLDEAKKKEIQVNLKELSSLLGVPVVGCSARNNEGLEQLKQTISNYEQGSVYKMVYSDKIESKVKKIMRYLEDYDLSSYNVRWLSLRILEQDTLVLERLSCILEKDFSIDEDFQSLLKEVVEEDLKEEVTKVFSKKSFEIVQKTVSFGRRDCHQKDRKIDKFLTNKYFGFLTMGVFLTIIFWLTIVGTNILSNWLFTFFNFIRIYLDRLFTFLSVSSKLTSFCLDGVYKVLTWVISVMLPPMAIFFPLFTILEDYGYLPRIAFNSDRIFHRCQACGKQALTMCMGFGCNVVGVTGCRIIDSPRERLLAILTNNFIPCNGRFPMILSIVSIFFTSSVYGFWSSFLSAIILCLIILLGVGMTFLICKVLSMTVLKGESSYFILELPSYRKPQFGKVIVRSIFDRTLFVLMRAIKVAIPAGAIIWILGNTMISGHSILFYLSSFFNPFGKWIGLDGVIVSAFLLGFPANEIVIPVMLMGYLNTGSLMEYSNLEMLRTILLDHHWTIMTALCFIVISLMHFPCATTLLTIKKETNSMKWTILSFLIPTLCGIGFCFMIRLLFQVLQYI